MKALLIKIIFILTVISVKGQDYSITDSLTSTIDINGIKFLEIICYCPNEIKIENTHANTIMVKMEGRLESIGYHGEQSKPENIKAEFLSFKIEKKKNTIRLISKEWTYIHHSFYIENLDLTIPNDIKYKIKKISFDKLEGRKIK